MKKTIIQILKYINNFPLPITAPHYAFFGPVGKHLKNDSLYSEGAWQILRDKHPHYKIPKNRDEWLRELAYNKDGQDAKLSERVTAFISLLRREGITTVYSVGSGGGVFEYHVKKKAPDIRIFTSEPTPQGVERLKKVFLECDKIEQFNALDPRAWEKIGQDSNGIVFIYRNEREFSDEDWKNMLIYMHNAGVKRVFLGLMNTLTLLAFTQERMRNIKHKIKREKLTFVGFLRNHARFKTFWNTMYNEEEIYFPNCRGLYLKINSFN